MLCNHFLFAVLGKEILSGLQPGATEVEKDRERFLKTLTRDLPAQFFCHECSRLHARDKSGAPGPALHKSTIRIRGSKKYCAWIRAKNQTACHESLDTSCHHAGSVSFWLLCKGIKGRIALNVTNNNILKFCKSWQADWILHISRHSPADDMRGCVGLDRLPSNLQNRLRCRLGNPRSSIDCPVVLPAIVYLHP